MGREVIKRGKKIVKEKLVFKDSFYSKKLLNSDIALEILEKEVQDNQW